MKQPTAQGKVAALHLVDAMAAQWTEMVASQSMPWARIKEEDSSEKTSGTVETALDHLKKHLPKMLKNTIPKCSKLEKVSDSRCSSPFHFHPNSSLHQHVGLVTGGARDA